MFCLAFFQADRVNVAVNNDESWDYTTTPSTGAPATFPGRRPPLQPTPVNHPGRLQLTLPVVSVKATGVPPPLFLWYFLVRTWDVVPSGEFCFVCVNKIVRVCTVVSKDFLLIIVYS